MGTTAEALMQLLSAIESTSQKRRKRERDRLTAVLDGERAGLGKCPRTVTEIEEDTDPYTNCQWNELGEAQYYITFCDVNFPCKRRGIQWIEGDKGSSTGLAGWEYAGEGNSIQYKH